MRATIMRRWCTAFRSVWMRERSSVFSGATAPVRRRRCARSWGGCVRLRGELYSRERRSRERRHRVFRKGIAFIPEDRRIFATLSVEENLILGLFSRRRSGAEQRLRLDRVFDLFPRLRERRRQLGKTLSGGEQQMLAIGRALVGSPKLLLVDEPSEGLAPMVVNEIFESLARMRSEGVALLLVEQNVRRAAAISSSCYVMEKGRIIKQGAPPDVMADEAVRQRLSV